MAVRSLPRGSQVSPANPAVESSDDAPRRAAGFSHLLGGTLYLVFHGWCDAAVGRHFNWQSQTRGFEKAKPFVRFGAVVKIGIQGERRLAGGSLDRQRNFQALPRGLEFAQFQDLRVG